MTDDIFNKALERMRNGGTKEDVVIYITGTIIRAARRSGTIIVLNLITIALLIALLVVAR